MAQSIERALSLIELTASGPLTLTVAADTLGVHKSTALRILQTLEAKRFLRKTRAGTYTLGHGLIVLAQQALAALDLREVANGQLRELQQVTGHTVHLAQLFEHEVVYVDKVDSPALHSVQIHSRIGRPVSLYATGVGKVILAFRSPADRARLLAGVELVQHTATTFATAPTLDGELSRIRERGWATDDGELHSLVNCIAVPIHDSNGDVIAALSITSMKVSAPLPQLAEHLALLLATAESISTEIGYTPGKVTH